LRAAEPESGSLCSSLVGLCGRTRDKMVAAQGWVVQHVVAVPQRFKGDFSQNLIRVISP